MILQENMVVADRYRLVRMIGRGGMGSVWQAQHIGLDTTCAVKFIEGELSNVAEAHARFEREAKAAAQLRSPHVVQIFDHGVWQGTPYIAMELLDGVDLGKRIQEKPGGRLDKAEINVVVQQVCRALTKAHNAGIVHRDLKPDNIFLVRDDDRELVKILDFGVAKSTAQAIDGSNTKTGAMLGTPYYMSPEQAQGIKSVDSRSDLWSLAVIVYQCVTGRLPFESEALGDLLVKIIVNPIPVPSQITTGVPPGFDKWWAKAADRNPENRFPTAKEFADSLAMALGQSSITDQHDRNALMRMAGGTALLQQSPVANVPGGTQAIGTGGYPPAGGVTSPAASTAFTTPNPAGPNAGAPQYHTPGQPLPPLGTTPNPHVGTGATFSGVEPPVGVPKKGPPIAILAVFGGLLVVGVVIGGAAIVKAKSGTTTGGQPIATSDSASVAVTTKPPDPPPNPTPSHEPPPPPPDTSTAGAGSAPTAPTNANPIPVAHNKPNPIVPKQPPPPPPASTPPKQPPPPPPKPSSTKPFDPGF